MGAVGVESAAESRESYASLPRATTAAPTADTYDAKDPTTFFADEVIASPPEDELSADGRQLLESLCQFEQLRLLAHADAARKLTEAAASPKRSGGDVLVRAV